MRYLKFICLLFTAFSLRVSAQETTKVIKRLTNNVSEVYHVSGDGHARQGMYQALYKKKIALANGAYKDNKRVGLWQFYNNRGTVVQSYNFDKNQFVYEAQEDTTSNIHYFVDRTFDTVKVANPRVNKPLRIGGVYYGYLPYVSLFKMPKRYSSADLDYSNVNVVVELLVSPGGRLADYTVHLIYAPLQTSIDDIRMNLKLPNPDDLVFVPASYEGEAVSCRIMIECVLNSNGTLDFAK